jgi:SAM-dependent methyltransferase
MQTAPLLQFNSFQDCIDYYKKHSQTEYKIKNGIESAHNNLLLYQNLHVDTKTHDEKTMILTVKDEAVERFHPNKINNKEFWKYAKTKFPKFSVCGAPSKSIKHCNELTLSMPEMAGFLDDIESFINHMPYGEKLKFFEIGYGHGNIFKKYKDRVDYLGIDYYKIKSLEKYKNLLVIEESGIPSFIEDHSLDVVYSVNVLQHCSQHDRFEYLEQASRKLKYGGYFFGTCFIHTEENKDTNVWGVQDASGRRYCNFFNQLTEVDTIMEFKDHATMLGYTGVKMLIGDVNTLFFVLRKNN